MPKQSKERVKEANLIKNLTPYSAHADEVVEVVGCVDYKGPRKSIKDMKEGIKKGATKGD